MSENTAPVYGSTYEVREVISTVSSLVEAEVAVSAHNAFAFDGQRYDSESNGTQWEVVLYQETIVTLAQYGDWIILSDGEQGTVTKMGPSVRLNNRQTGTYYHVMTKGGFERFYTHWDGDDFLTVAPGFGREETAEPYFTVVDATMINAAV